MKNWAKNLEFQPNSIHAPTSALEIQGIVKQHAGHIRTRGSAHSWTELIKSEDAYLHLDNLQGIISVDKNNHTITAHAGTKLALFGAEAFKHGYSMVNQGDINSQSLAGSMSTGTHGTGLSLKSMANLIESLRMVDGHGELITISKESEQNKAAGVSFGSLGIITDATVKMLPAYKLKVESFHEDLSVSLVKHSERIKNNRHLEMFYFPVGDWSMVKMMNITQDEVSKKSFAHQFNDVVLENWLYEGINVLATKTGSYKRLDAFMRKFVSHQVKVNWAHHAFPTHRSVRFMEMEFNLPVAKFEEVLDEIKAYIKRHKVETLFPIEIRFVAKDDLWLSPAFDRDSVYFAVHTYITENFRPYFEGVQEIFKKHQGRPHWGKWHSLSASYFSQVYPKWDAFLKVRKEFDPQERFLNPHLRSLFGLA